MIGWCNSMSSFDVFEHLVKDPANLAWQEVQRRGVPTRKDEDWKYTNVKPLFEHNWKAASGLSTEQVAEIQKNHDAHLVIFDKTYGLDSLSGIEGLKTKSSDMATFDSSFYQDLKQDSFYFLNQTLAPEEIHINVTKNTVMKNPLVIVHVSGAEAASARRIHVRMEQNSELVVIEKFISLDSESEGLGQSSLEVHLEQDARFQNYQIHQQNKSNTQVGSVYVWQERGSQSQLFNMAQGSRWLRQNVNVRLLGERARAEVQSLSLLHEQQHADHCTVIEHMAPYTECDQLYKSILQDRSRYVFNGMVHVHQMAQKTEAAQLNKNLVIDPTAEADTRPQLKVDADDVKAAHGATIGQLDPEEVFYLMSRSIPEAQAVSLLSRAFAQDVLMKVANKAAQKTLQELMLQCSQMIQLEEKMRASVTSRS